MCQELYNMYAEALTGMLKKDKVKKVQPHTQPCTGTEMLRVVLKWLNIEKYPSMTTLFHQ